METGFRKGAAEVGDRMKAPEKKYYLYYTILFVLLSIGTFFWFALYGRSLVRGGDGYYQHTKALAFYGKWLRDILHTIFVEHSFSLPAYSLSMGFGADALTTMHYYVLGDPFNLLAVFVPQEKTAILYECLIFARMYVAGLVFSYFCRFHGRDDDGSVLAGSIMYVFTSYVMFAGVRHPYFINPMIWFPLILIGAEKVRQKRGYVLFSVSVCMAAVSNFYFFYMIVLLTVMYVLWRCFCIFRRGELSGALIWIGRLFAGAVTGVLMSAVIFWPVMRLFLASSRTGTDGQIYAMYRVSYYLTIPSSFMTFVGPGNWTHMGYTGIGMIAVLVLFLMKKKYTSLKSAFVILALMLLIPFGGYMMNGFIYVLNRWTWAVALLTSYILVVVWEDMFSLKKRQLIILGILLALLTAEVMICAYYAKYNGLAQCLVAWAGAGALYAAVKRPSLRGTMKKAVCLLLCAGVVINGWFAYSRRWAGYADEFKTNEQMTRYITPEEIAQGDPDIIRLARSNFLNTEAEAVALLEDGATVRYDGHKLTRNGTVLNGMHATMFYWSLANENLDAFLQQMGNREYLGYSYKGLDDRTRMMIISGVRYFCSNDINYVPYGYEKIGSDKNPLDNAWPVYENKNALPLGFAYDAYITADKFNASDALGREEMLMQAVSLEDTSGVEALGIRKAEPEYTVETLPYEITLGTPKEPLAESEETAKILENGIQTFAPDMTITLTFNGLPDSETLAVFKGLDYTDGRVPFSELSFRNKLWRLRYNTYASEPAEIDLTLRAGMEGEESDVSKQLTYYTRMHEWYNGRHDFVVNLDYREKERSYITITLSKKGVYTWDSLDVAAAPMKGIDAQAAALKKDVLTDIDLHPQGEACLTDLVTGHISLEEPKILFVSIPHDEGWTAVVDGEKTSILRADNMFMAIPLDAGEHEIELHYRTPGFTAGLIMTLAGFAALLLLHLKARKYTRSNTKQEE